MKFIFDTMLEALALHFHGGEDQAVPYEMRRVSYSLTSFETANTRYPLNYMHITNVEKQNFTRLSI